MKPQAMSTMLCAAAALLLVVARIRWQAALPVSPTPDLTISLLPPAAAVPSDDSLSDAEAMVTEHDPFRIAGAPASVRFDARGDATGAAQPAYVPPPRPTLVLRAIVGGPPWQAVIDGLPGQPPGAIVRRGDQFAQLVVRDVGRDSVIVKGADTSWVLTFRSRP